MWKGVITTANFPNWFFTTSFYFFVFELVFYYNSFIVHLPYFLLFLFVSVFIFLLFFHCSFSFFSSMTTTELRCGGRPKVAARKTKARRRRGGCQKFREYEVDLPSSSVHFFSSMFPLCNEVFGEKRKQKQIQKQQVPNSNQNSVPNSIQNSWTRFWFWI